MLAIKAGKRLLLHERRRYASGTEVKQAKEACNANPGVPANIRQKIGVLNYTTDGSMGIEHPSDLIADVAQALNEA
jgi:methionine-gamma-lyase